MKESFENGEAITFDEVDEKREELARLSMKILQVESEEDRLKMQEEIDQLQKEIGTESENL